MFSPVIKRSFAVAAAGTVYASSMTTAYAEEKRSKSVYQKLSIYDEPEPKVVIVEAPTKLEEQVFIVQKYANETVEEGKSYVNSWVQKYEELENKVTSTINNTIDKNEEVFPNILYVGVAALAGTIIARNRNVVLRFLTSTALATGASYYLLPKTTQNVFQHLEKLENQYPPIKSAHQTVNHTVNDVCQQVDSTLSHLSGMVDANTSKLREQIESKTKEVKHQVDSVLGSSSAETSKKMNEVKKNVEGMYSTRSNPGVEDTLKKE
ncbi:apolipo protein O-domain-containing protein [Pilobolus umbonatus]|nr:apolipo protein O-domain-containing protein [Pilobolus umbonatus]